MGHGRRGRGDRGSRGRHDGRQPLDALLLECTDLSVFARTVQEAVSVPVYDINSLIAYAAFCVRRNQWV